MSTTHMFIGSKGGIGKSLCAAHLASYLSRKSIPVSCFDTDPLNRTLGGYNAFSVKVLSLVDPDSQQINPRAFDTFVEQDLMRLSGASHAVIDNGSSTYMPWCAYMAENPVLPMLLAMGQQVYIHTVVTGGQALNDTYSCLDKLMSVFTDVPFVIWINRFFGPVEKDKIPFEKSELLKANAPKIHAVLKIPHLNPATYGEDIKDMLAAKKTVAQIMAEADDLTALEEQAQKDSESDREGRQPLQARLSAIPGIMSRQRLQIFERLMNEELDKARLV